MDVSGTTRGSTTGGYGVPAQSPDKKNGINGVSFSSMGAFIKKTALNIKDQVSDKISDLRQRSPLDTITFRETMRIATPPEKLKHFNVMSNVPLDSVKISDTQKKVIQEKIEANRALMKDNPADQKLIKKDKELTSLLNKTTVRYYNVTDEQKKALDEGKFREIQYHLNNFSTAKTSHESALFAEKGIKYEEAHVGEILSKAVAYLDPSVLRGQKILLPVDGKMVEYTINTHAMADGKLPFITLTSQDPGAKPWIVIRGTDPNIVGKSAKNSEAKESALASIAADFAKEISTDSVDDHMREFSKIFSQFSPQEVNIAGHSLGAFLAQQLSVNAKESGISNVGTVYSFNSPGVSKKTAERYEALKDNQPNIKVFCKKGDVISCGGKKILGDAFLIEQGDTAPDVAHREIDFNKQFSISNVNVPEEEKKGSRLLVEGARKNIGRPLVAASLPFFKP